VRAGHFSEGIFRNFSEDVYLCGSTALLGNFRAPKTRSERIHSLQPSQNELAEPFKYSNTLHTSSTIVCCIPHMTANDHGKRSCERALRTKRSFASLRISTGALLRSEEFFETTQSVPAQRL